MNLRFPFGKTPSIATDPGTIKTQIPAAGRSRVTTPSLPRADDNTFGEVVTSAGAQILKAPGDVLPSPGDDNAAMRACEYRLAEG